MPAQQKESPNLTEATNPLPFKVSSIGGGRRGESFSPTFSISESQLLLPKKLYQLSHPSTLPKNTSLQLPNQIPRWNPASKYRYITCYKVEVDKLFWVQVTFQICLNGVAGPRHFCVHRAVHTKLVSFYHKIWPIQFVVYFTASLKIISKAACTVTPVF